MGWPRCRVTDRHTWRRGPGGVGRCTCGAGTASTPQRWRGSTAGSAMLGDDGRRTGWHDTPVSYGAIGRISIGLDGLPTLHASSVQLDAMGTAVWLSDLPDDAPSVRLARLVRPRRRTGATHRVERSHPPRRRRGGPVHRRPMATGHDRRPSTSCCSSSTLRCRRSAPLVPAPTPPASTPNSSTASPARILHQYGWKADLGRQRTPSIQALRATFGAPREARPRRARWHRRVRCRAAATP